jgi:RNA polymerase sigma-70 factor (ECF subfamily)
MAVDGLPFSKRPAGLPWVFSCAQGRILAQTANFSCNKMHRSGVYPNAMGTMMQESLDAERVAEWVREHGGAVRGYLRGVVGLADCLDDLFQEVFFRTWQGRSQYEERGFARSYLLQIADRVACDRFRRTKSEPTLGDEIWSIEEPAKNAMNPAVIVASAETTRRLDAALKQLAPIQRRALLLRYFGQLTFVEIAEAIDCPLNTALSHCHRGLQALRKHFERDEP